MLGQETQTKVGFLFHLFSYQVLQSHILEFLIIGNGMIRVTIIIIIIIIMIAQKCWNLLVGDTHTQAYMCLENQK
jgi:hypothetical protein